MRAFSFFAAAFALVGTAFAQTPSAEVAHGFIVRLKPDSRLIAPIGNREAAQSLRDRMGTVMLDAQLSERVVGSSQRSINSNLESIKLSRAIRGAELDDALRRLRLHPQVESVEADVMLKPQRTANDPQANRQWALTAPISPFLSSLDVHGAWDLTLGKPNVVVAVLDSGIRPHPDLEGRTVAGYDFVSEVEYAADGNGRDADPTDPGDFVSSDDKARSRLFDSCDVANSSWHGTFIAGQIAAATDNAVGISGAVFNGRVMPVRVAGKCGALLSDLLDGMRWAGGLNVANVPANANPARVLNISFGGSTACANSGYQSVIDELAARGVLTVVAAGNESAEPRRPADCRNIISVGAVRADGMKTRYSSLGAAVTLMAPGGSSERQDTLMFSTTNSGAQGPQGEGYGTKQGTSFSAPWGAAVAALMWGVHPQLSNDELIARMRLGVRPFVNDPNFPACSLPNASSAGATQICNCNVNVCGTGMLDARLAVQQALAPRVRVAAVTGALAQASSLLDGSASTSGEGTGPLIYRWFQTAGPVATLASPATVSTTVAITGLGTHTFVLRITDAQNRQTENSVTFNVTQSANSAPPANTPTTPTPTPVPPPASSGGGGGSMGGLDLLLLALAALALAVAQRRAKI